MREEKESFFVCLVFFSYFCEEFFWGGGNMRFLRDEFGNT